MRASVTMSPFATWLISCPSTASASSLSMAASNPVLTATRALLRLMPVAKALMSGGAVAPGPLLRHPLRQGEREEGATEPAHPPENQLRLELEPAGKLLRPEEIHDE